MSMNLVATNGSDRTPRDFSLRSHIEADIALRSHIQIRRFLDRTSLGGHSCE